MLSVFDLKILLSENFSETFIDLCLRLSPSNGKALFAAYSEYLFATFVESPTSPSDRFPMAVAAVVSTVLRHLDFGMPLYMDDALFAL